MTTSSHFLRRFRFHGVPGAAVGVPIDRASALEHELSDVFGQLGETQQEVAEITSAAEQSAEQRRRAGAAEAFQILASARAAAQSERSKAAAVAIADAERLKKQLLSDANTEAARIESAAAERVAPLTALVVTRVLARGVPER